MANKEHLKILRQGVKAWNEWRVNNRNVNADLGGASLARAHLSYADFRNARLAGAHLPGINLRNADMAGANLSYAHLTHADLSNAVLTGSNLVEADLSEADLSNAFLENALLHNAYLGNACLAGAHLISADLVGANLNHADLTHVHLNRADLSEAFLAGANLRGADLSGADLSKVDLNGADLADANLDGVNLAGADLADVILSRARLYMTAFTNCDLRDVIGLEFVEHRGPSEISISTLYRSEGKIPEKFLLGCGVPESFIVQIPALVSAVQPIQFHSCFISYSSKDEEFAKRLHSRMREADLRVWFAPEDMKGGDYFFEQIDRAIQIHDRLLLVLSENSMASDWVIREIKRARKAEARENRKKLFPISLTGYEALRGWECLDHDSGLDLAEEVRRFHIPDFSNWKSHDEFEKAFARLHNDLKKSAEGR